MRHLLAAYNLNRDRLYGHVNRRKSPSGVRLGAGQVAQSGCGDQAVVKGELFGGAQLPGGMDVGDVPGATAPRDMQTPALQEIVWRHTRGVNGDSFMTPIGVIL